METADTAVDIKVFTSADELLGKIVTIRNVEYQDLSITGKVDEVKVADNNGVAFISEISFKIAGSRDLYTPARAANKYATKSWYWIVESIA